MAQYAAHALAFTAGHTVGRLANFGTCEVLEGPAVEGVAILEFDTVDAARDWYRSPAYRKASRHRHLGADSAAVIVEGAKRPAAATSIPE